MNGAEERSASTALWPSAESLADLSEDVISEPLESSWKRSSTFEPTGASPGAAQREYMRWRIWFSMYAFTSGRSRQSALLPLPPVPLPPSPCIRPWPTRVFTSATGPPSGEPSTSRLLATPSRTDEPLPMFTTVPVPVVSPRVTIWRGPADDPTGCAASAGPRSAGAALAPMSTLAVCAAASESETLTCSATTVVCAMSLGALIGATLLRSSALAFTDGAACWITVGLMIVGASAWACGLKSSDFRSASALGAGAGSGSGSFVASTLGSSGGGGGAAAPLP